MFLFSNDEKYPKSVLYYVRNLLLKPVDPKIVVIVDRWSFSRGGFCLALTELARLHKTLDILKNLT